MSREAIPLAARIVRVADVFDALTHARPYKDAWTLDRVLDEIERGAGTLFDPDLARQMVALVQAREVIETPGMIGVTEGKSIIRAVAPAAATATVRPALL